MPLLVCIGSKNAPRQDAYFGGYKWGKDIISKLEKAGNNETIPGASPETSITKLSVLKVANITAYKYQELPDEGVGYTGVVFAKEPNTYLLMFRRLTPKDLTEEEFRRILPTFKFLN